jgi:hypothetical protein
MSDKTNFRVEVRFKPILKVSWLGPNVKGDRPFEQRQHIDVNEVLKLEPKYENGKFVTAYLTASTTGMVWMVLDDEAQFKLLDQAIKEAREREVPKPFGYGENPKTFVKVSVLAERRKKKLHRRKR